MTAEPPAFRTKSQIVCDELRRRIVFGSLPPGQRLLLKDIAAQFGCSEIPVRDAVRSLAAMGLVEVIPHGGAFVAKFDLQEIVHLTSVRALLEPEATCQGAAAITPEALDRLDALGDEMKACIAENRVDAFSGLNRKFHSLIMSFAPNRRLVATIDDLWNRAERGRLVYARGLPHLTASVVQHGELIALIRAGDQEGLRAASARHSRFGLDAIRNLADWTFQPADAAEAPRKTGSRP